MDGLHRRTRHSYFDLADGPVSFRRSPTSSAPVAFNGLDVVEFVAKGGQPAGNPEIQFG
jgi:hypothetical protein